MSYAEGNTSGPLNRESIADLPLLRTLLAICQKSREPSFWKVMYSFVLLAYASLAASGDLLKWLLAWLNFRFRKFILLVQTKEEISMNYGSSTSCWKPCWWVRFDLILTMRDMYINSNLNPFTKFTISRSTEFITCPFPKCFQILYIFAQIFKYFSFFLPFFLVLFLKIACMPLLSRIGPDIVATFIQRKVNI